MLSLMAKSSVRQPMTHHSCLTLDAKGCKHSEEVRAALAVWAGDLILLERTERGTSRKQARSIRERGADRPCFHSLRSSQ